MHKSSIYLPDELKRSLSARAAASGRSEADLIRHAIEHLLAVSSAPASAGETLVSDVELDVTRPMLVGVGVGPGDPGLVTRRAVAVLREADRVVVASTDAHSVGRAEAVVRAVAPLATIQRVAFRIGPDDDREASLEDLVGAVISGVDAGELVALAVLGDPSQWTVFPHAAARVRHQRPGLRIAAMPGITTYQAAAATAAIGLGDAKTTLVVTSQPDRAREAIERGDAVVLHKSTTDGATIRSLVSGSQRAGAVVAELTGLPGERLQSAFDVPDGPLAYLSALLVPSPVSVAAP